MITNLLDKTVVQYDTNLIGKVCAVTEDLRVVFVSENGVFQVSDIRYLKLYESRDYCVTFVWDGTNKIKAIKLVREYRQLDLRSAKDLVEKSCTVKAKENLTYDEAMTLKGHLETEGFRAKIMQQKEDNGGDVINADYPVG